MSVLPVSRNIGLDLVRGLCAIGVVTYHFLAWYLDFTIQSLGTFGVYTFFIISAVALMVRYASEFTDVIPAAAANKFFRNRLGRILPLLMLVAMFSFLFSGGRLISKDLIKPILTGTGLFSLHIPGFISTVVGAWSLAIECLFYLLFPLICMFVMQMRWKLLAFIFVMSIVVQQSLISLLPDHNTTEFWWLYTMPLTFAPFFIAGLLIYRSEKIESVWLFPVGIVVLLTCLLSSIFVKAELFRGGPAYIAMVVGCMVAVALLYWSHIPNSLAPASVFVGEISYSLYLSHWLAFYLAKQTTFVGPAFFVLALGLSCLLTYGFERPVRRLIAH